MMNKKMILSVLIIAFVAVGIAGATWAYLPSNELKPVSDISLATPGITATSSFDAISIVPQTGVQKNLGSIGVSSDTVAPGELFVTSTSTTGTIAGWLKVYANGHLIYDGTASGFVGTPVDTGISISSTSPATIPFTYEFEGSSTVDQSTLTATTVTVGITERVGE